MMDEVASCDVDTLFQMPPEALLDSIRHKGDPTPTPADAACKADDHRKALFRNANSN